MTPLQSPHLGGCSSSAGSSIRQASRCRTPRPWFMRVARHSGFHPCLDQLHPIPIGDARADGSGRFHLDAPRTSSSRYDIVGAVAIAPGYGVGCVDLDPDADQPAADITLRREQLIHGRLFDVQGRPVPDVVISVSGVCPDAVPRHATMTLPRSEGNVTFWWANANDFPAWPRPATTDALGHFTVHGVGRNMRAFLTARHPRFALQEITDRDR